MLIQARLSALRLSVKRCLLKIKNRVRFLRTLRELALSGLRVRKVKKSSKLYSAVPQS